MKLLLNVKGFKSFIVFCNGLKNKPLLQDHSRLWKNSTS